MNKKLIGSNFSSNNYKIFIFLFILIILPTKVFTIENKILLKIDNEIITTVDILNEIQYLKLLNKDFKNFEKDKIFKIAKNSITKDVIKKNELKKYFKKVELDKAFLDKFILEYFSKLNLVSIESLEKYLIKINIKPEYIKKKNNNTINVE